jgi:hypothetical protein
VLWSYLAVVACLAGSTYALAVTALTARPVRVDSGGGLTAVDSPPGNSAWAIFDRLIFPVFVAFWLSFVVAQVLSWRRSSGDRRQQLKWLMSGAAVLAVSQVICQPVLNFYPDLPTEVPFGRGMKTRRQGAVTGARSGGSTRVPRQGSATWGDQFAG